jgi:hypothetical protein
VVSSPLVIVRGGAEVSTPGASGEDGASGEAGYELGPAYALE